MTDLPADVAALLQKLDRVGGDYDYWSDRIADLHAVLKQYAIRAVEAEAAVAEWRETARLLRASCHAEMLAKSSERESCAGVCDDHATEITNSGRETGGVTASLRCAARIRARSGVEMAE